MGKGDTVHAVRRTPLPSHVIDAALVHAAG